MQEEVWDYYRHHARNLPWRQPEADGSFDPYKILVSEIMLQQTQVGRVIPKYRSFLKQFPDATALSESSLADVLQAWSGLGYNRRAKFLHQASQQLAHGFPQNLKELVKLPGVGVNTAAAIMNYAFNKATPFIETNIRTVYIHHYFNDHIEVDDKQLMPLIVETLDHEHPREWFWALMDYGSHLKLTVGNLNRNSKQYAKQSRFEGSRRQIRGQVLRRLVDPQSLQKLSAAIPDERLGQVLEDLLKEGLIVKNKSLYQLPS